MFWSKKYSPFYVVLVICKINSSISTLSGAGLFLCSARSESKGSDRLCNPGFLVAQMALLPSPPASNNPQCCQNHGFFRQIWNFLDENMIEKNCPFLNTLNLIPDR